MRAVGRAVGGVSSGVSAGVSVWVITHFFFLLVRSMIGMELWSGARSQGEE